MVWTESDIGFDGGEYFITGVLSVNGWIRRMEKKEFV